MSVNAVERVVKFLEKNKFEICLFTCVFLIGLFLFFKLSFIRFSFIYTLIVFLAVFVTFVLKKYKLNLENKFLLLVIPLGTMMLIAIPLGNIPDERAHLARAWEISDFHLTSKISEDGTTSGRELPIEIDYLASSNLSYKEINANLLKNSGERIFMGFPNTSLYSFASYLPQTIGIWLGKIFNLPIYLTAYLARIINFIFWVILLYVSIKLIPFCKNIIFFISLLPIALQEGVSLSPDGFTFALSVLLFSYVINKVRSKTSLNKKDYIFMFIVCTLLALCKIVYLPLCLLIILIPYKNFGTKKKKWIFIGSLASFVVLINLVWLIYANDLLQFARYDSTEQKQFILNNPFNYLLVIMRTVVYRGEEIVDGLFGYSLESFNIKMPYLTYYANMIIFGVLCYKESQSKNACSKYIKLMITFIIFSIFILVNTSLYIQWTAPHASMVDGIQGRYFLPVIFMIPLLFMKNCDKLKIERNDKQTNFLIYFMFIQNILAISFMIVLHFN